MEPLFDVISVKVVADQRLRLGFEDGTVGEVDFSDRKWSGVLAPLADPEFFAQVFVDTDAGTISWPGELDLAPEPLYEAALRSASPAATHG